MWEESELVLAFPFAQGECHLFGEDIREPLRSREYPAIQAQAQTRPRWGEGNQVMIPYSRERGSSPGCLLNWFGASKSDVRADGSFAISRKFLFEQGSAFTSLSERHSLRVCSQFAMYLLGPSSLPTLLSIPVTWVSCCGIQQFPLTQKICDLLWVTKMGFYSHSYELQRGHNLRRGRVRILEEVWPPNCLQPLLALHHLPAPIYLPWDIRSQPGEAIYSNPPNTPDGCTSNSLHE